MSIGILDENLENLVDHMKAKRYKPQPVKRVYLPNEQIILCLLDSVYKGMGAGSDKEEDSPDGRVYPNSGRGRGKFRRKWTHGAAG